jgi:hypothetical protein
MRSWIADPTAHATFFRDDPTRAVRPRNRNGEETATAREEDVLTVGGSWTAEATQGGSGAARRLYVVDPVVLVRRRPAGADADEVDAGGATDGLLADAVGAQGAGGATMTRSRTSGCSARRSRQAREGPGRRQG